jgi:hypothetical protein
MHIDRARFLLITASLAGGGCSSTTQPAALPMPEPTATSSEVVVPETPEPDETAVAVATAAPRPTAVATAEPVEPASGPCDNDTATVPACALRAPPGPSCESFSDTVASCKSFKSGLRGAVAAKAVACLNAASGKQSVCDYTKAETCAVSAIRSACIQPSTFNACSPLVSACAGSSYSKLTMQDCQTLLSAVKDGKRAAMITCMTEGCSIDSCMWSLR